MRKRSKYRPRPVYNPLHYVLEGFRPVRQHRDYTNLIVRNHLAGQALMRGDALLRQALEALAYWLEHGETPGSHDIIQRTHDVLQERLK